MGYNKGYRVSHLIFNSRIQNQRPDPDPDPDPLIAAGQEFDGVMLRSIVTRRCPGIGFLSTADAIS